MMSFCNIDRFKKINFRLVPDGEHFENRIIFSRPPRLYKLIQIISTALNTSNVGNFGGILEITIV